MPVERLLFFVKRGDPNYAGKTLVKRIQHFTEQRTTFVLGEILDSFDHFLYCARCCSMLRCGIWWRSEMLGEQLNISFGLGVAVRCLVKCWIRLTTLSSLLDSCMPSFIQFRKCKPRNNLDTKVGFLFTSQRSRNSLKCWA